MARNRAIVWSVLFLIVVAIAWFALRPRRAPTSGTHTEIVAHDEDASVTVAQPVIDVPPPRIVATRERSDAALVIGDGSLGAMHAPHVIVRARWGSGSGQLGHDRRSEGNAEAPMSLTTDAHGNLLVLDQVNHRIARFSPDGHPLAPISLPVRAAQDLAVARDGTIAVLDRLGDSTVALVAPDGSVRAQIPLVGNGIPEGGGTTGIFVDGDDVYVEREHGPLVLIGDVSGQQDEGRTEIPGRPTRDGSAFISAGLIDAPTGRFYVNSVARDTRENRFTRALQVPLVLHNILLLDTDRAGTIYVAVSGETPGATDPNAANESALLLCLDPAEGRPTGQATLPVNAGPDETFREMTVLDGGGVVMSVDTEDGVTLEQFNCS